MKQHKQIKDINNTFTKSIPQNLTWYLIDAKEKNLGRLSSQIAHILMGKDIKEYSPFQESDKQIIIINSKYINVTGKKDKQKTYKRHSGRPGGLKTETFNKLKTRIPNRIIEHSIRGMLPKNNLGRKLFKKLKIYSENQHPHTAQQPIELNIK
uniref:Large ribosomal subunit protein uL13c n=1 Tax=Laurencia australis TaxID=3073067 RepID=A0AA51RC79_9FLOR|nr:50S ribosomal protein L13 [Laurencia australis]WMP12110.1 50S ribosomal protein L13 [Laurencia australis]